MPKCQVRSGWLSASHWLVLVRGQAGGSFLLVFPPLLSTRASIQFLVGNRRVCLHIIHLRQCKQRFLQGESAWGVDAARGGGGQISPLVVVMVLPSPMAVGIIIARLNPRKTDGNILQQWTWTAKHRGQRSTAHQCCLETMQTTRDSRRNFYAK